MTNQVNQYERHMAIQEAYQIHDSDEYFKARPQLECGDRRKVFYAGHIRGYQAATKASESEINSLKERVEELQADNNKLREALEKTFSRPKLQNEIDNILSSTPAQSLAEHDNEVLSKVISLLEDMNANGKHCLPDYIEAIRALKVTP